MNVVYSIPGQNIQLLLDLKDSDGYRYNSITTPIVTQIYNNLNPLDISGEFTQLDVGLYIFEYQTSKMYNSLGSYLFDVTYSNKNGLINKTIFQVISRMAPSQSGGYITGIQL